MKKLLTILFTAFFISSAPAIAEVGIGITGTFAKVESEGHTLAKTGTRPDKSVGSSSEDVVIAEVFAEVMTDNGFAVGVSYIPTRDMGSKTRKDTETSVDGTNTTTSNSATYKGDAEVDDLIMFYADIPIGPVYAKLGIQRATIVSLESLNSGSTYDNTDVTGTTIGLGYKSDFGGSLYYKGEVTKTKFDDISINNSTNTETVEGEIDVTSAKLSLGYKF
tara:strand:+ start:228 stop:887 length:660 start_codon:yes stop_codon:yes gene_type:complete